MGLILARPVGSAGRFGNRTVRLHLHRWLATFTLAFLLLHVFALAFDAKAGVGVDALIPLRSHYEPVAVGLGTVALYAGLIAGLTAQFAGRWLGRFWWPIHKIVVVVFALAWLHAVFAGSDSKLLLLMYLMTGAAVAVFAVRRYRGQLPLLTVPASGRGTP